MSNTINVNYMTRALNCVNGFRITRIAWRKSINFLHGKRFLTKLVERMKESGRKKNWIRDI